MLHTTRGIVLHTLKYSDTSLVCKVYTEVLGLQSYMIKGVRSTRNQGKAAILRPPNILDMVVYHKERRGLQNVREFKLSYIYQSLPYDIVKGAISMFMVEVLNKSVKEEEQNEALFEFILEAFQQLDTTKDPLQYKPHEFLLNLAGYLGFGPEGNYNTEQAIFDMMEGSFVKHEPPHPNFLMGKSAQTVSNLLNSETPVGLNGAERRQLLQQLLTFYALHIESFAEIRSHKVLQDVLG